MLSEIVRNYEASTVSKDMVMQFGDKHDGVIEFAGLVDKGVIEIGYYYGDDKPKNIIVISSQVGCPMRCKFCEAGSEKFVRNLSPEEMYDQVMLMLKEADRYMDIDVRHKVNIAKTGEPLFNKQLVEGLERIAELGFSFKVATILPRGVMNNYYRVSKFAASYDEPVQMQVSVISTSEEYRREASGRTVASFKEIRDAADHWMNENPERKVNLSLILTEDVPCDVNDVCDVFPPELFNFRFRNYVPTEKGKALNTISQERFERIKESFRQKGYEVRDWATPTATELKFGLAANVTRKRYMKMVENKF